MKRQSRTKSTQYVRKGTIRIVNGKAVTSEENIGEPSRTADTAPTLEQIRQGGSNPYEAVEMSKDFNW